MAKTTKPRAHDGASLALLADIFDAGSLTTAARNLGTSQPALSKRLQRVEQALGVSVFERGTRGVVPTEYGAALLPRARSIRAQSRQAAEEIAQMRGWICLLQLGGDSQASSSPACAKAHRISP